MHKGGSPSRVALCICFVLGLQCLQMLQQPVQVGPIGLLYVARLLSCGQTGLAHKFVRYLSLQVPALVWHGWSNVTPGLSCADCQPSLSGHHGLTKACLVHGVMLLMMSICFWPLLSYQFDAPFESPSDQGVFHSLYVPLEFTSIQ